MLNDRKLGGVLVESKVKGTKFMYALLGMGVNANFETYRVNTLQRTSISLQDVLRSPICREALVSTILNETEKLLDLSSPTEQDRILPLLMRFDWSRGRNARIQLEDRELVGVIDGYETLSKVRVHTAQGLEMVVTSNAVSVEYESN
jgi:biotin-(acetyl-CoA carboxylase) ligase